MRIRWLSLLVFLVAVLGSSLVQAQNVTITPLGAQAGEFCAGDRALLFEDPTGVKVLIAPGRTVGADLGAFVSGSADTRLGGERTCSADRSSSRRSHRRCLSHQLWRHHIQSV